MTRILIAAALAMALYGCAMFDEPPPPDTAQAVAETFAELDARASSILAGLALPDLERRAQAQVDAVRLRLDMELAEARLRSLAVNEQMAAEFRAAQARQAEALLRDRLGLPR